VFGQFTDNITLASSQLAVSTVKHSAPWNSLFFSPRAIASGIYFPPDCLRGPFLSADTFKWY